MEKTVVSIATAYQIAHIVLKMYLNIFGLPHLTGQSQACLVLMKKIRKNTSFRYFIYSLPFL